jgi:hypothetical protein
MRVIPRNFYYYWTGQQFQYVHYLAVLSLVRSTGCTRVDVYYEEAPRGNPHWERLRTLDRVSLVPVDFGELIRRAGYEAARFEKFLKVAKVVHRSDFVRYLALGRGGGVYLDFDTLVVRDLEPLLQRRLLVGYQNTDELGNDVNGAVLGAEPESPVIRECLERVRALPETLTWLRPSNLRFGTLKKFLVPHLHWCDSGPSLLSQLSRENDELRQALCPRSYFHFCDYRDWKSIFSEGELPDDAFVIHYFGKLSFEFTKGVDDKYVRDTESLYARAARRYVTDSP